MSIKSLLMPAISQRLLSQERLLAQRRRAERRRVARGEPHQVHYFHQTDDPYSALAAAALPRLMQRYDIQLLPHLVGAPPDHAAPERDKLVAYSRKDAQRLARHLGLDFDDPQAQPAAEAVEHTSRWLLGAIESARFVELAQPLSAQLWRGSVPAASPPVAAASAAALHAHREAANRLRERLGHYLGATFHYGGEWYWGLDRLHHLEWRLQGLGAQRAGIDTALFAPDADGFDAPALQDAPRIDFYFSLRSPYSAIAAPRVLALGRASGAPVRLCPLLPMVMRGLPVPAAKRRYIAFDAAREARLHGVPFGRINDPVGRPTERGLALFPLAEQAGRAPQYLLSFMQGVWAEGLDAGSDRGLRRIAERAGLAWPDAQAALEDDGWRQSAEAHRAEMFALGLWGVPSFRVRDTAVWGQDRLWAVRQALLESPRRASPDIEPAA